jgi:hypothetical protein
MADAIKERIRRQALAYNLDPQTMTRIAQIESSLNPNAKNPNSSASGLYQFINSTGRQYGLKNPFDPDQNIDAAMRFTSDNVNTLKRSLGRDPTPGEIYLAHQQGVGGAKKLLMNPDAPAVDLVGSAAVRLNGGHSGMTARDFAAKWDRKMTPPTALDPQQAANLGMSPEDLRRYNDGATPPQQPAQPLQVDVAPRPLQSGDAVQLPGGNMGSYSHGNLAIPQGDTTGRYAALGNIDPNSPGFLQALAALLKA